MLLLNFLLEFLIFPVQVNVLACEFDNIGAGVLLIVFFVKEAHFISAVKT